MCVHYAFSDIDIRDGSMIRDRRRAQVKTKAETALSINEIIDAPCFARRNNPVRRRWTSLHRVKGCSHVRINRSKVVSRALANLYIFLCLDLLLAVSRSELHNVDVLRKSSVSYRNIL